jgi:ATP-dependent metalloprotease
MGGRVAEEMIFGEDNVTSGAHSDIRKATEVARRMVRNLGMDDKVGPVNYSDEDMYQLSTETKVLIENAIKGLVMVRKRGAGLVQNRGLI